MPNDGIFGSDQNQSVTQTPAVNTTTTQSDTLPESVALLVGPGRKYKDLDALAKGHLAADEFVETLKSENATLRDEVKKSTTLDEVLKRLEKPATSGTQDPSATTTQSGLTAAQVASIVRAQITGVETERTQSANLQKADAEMRTLFGDKAKDVFEKEASTPELKKALMALASVSPDKFVALFRPATGGATTDNTTSVNTAALTGGNASGRASDPSCKEYYDNLRRTKPADYYSQAVQLQMNKAAQSNSNKFFGRGS